MCLWVSGRRNSRQDPCTRVVIAWLQRVATPQACYRGLSGPSGRRKQGCPRECPTECLRSASGPGLRSVQRVSRERDTFLTLRGHSRGTFWTLRPKGPGDTEWDTPLETPILGDTPRDISGLKGPKDPCSRPGGSEAETNIYRGTSMLSLSLSLSRFPSRELNLRSCIRADATKCRSGTHEDEAAQ